MHQNTFSFDKKMGEKRRHAIPLTDLDNSDFSTFGENLMKFEHNVANVTAHLTKGPSSYVLEVTCTIIIFQL